ncbi:MAG: metallophosphoesterase [Bacteroidota bacterium]
MPDLTLLHLSDLHLGPHSRFQDIPPKELALVVVASAKKGAERLDASERPDLVVVTGDLVETGMPKQFRELALPFFEALVGALGLPRERFVFLPGNHDVNWLTSSSAANDFALGETDATTEREAIDAAKLRYYDQFITDFYGDQGSAPRFVLPTGKGAVMYDYPDLRVSFAALNSCEVESHRPDDHRGHLSEVQTTAVRQHWALSKQKAWLKLIGVHHNPTPTIPDNVKSWLDYLHKESDLGDNYLLRAQSDILGTESDPASRGFLKHLAEDHHVPLVLHGHHHATTDDSWTWDGGLTHVLSSGSWGLAPGKLPGEQPNTMRLLHIRPEQPEIRGQLLQFDPLSRAKGANRAGAFSPSGEPKSFLLALPEGFDAEAKNVAPESTTEAQNDRLTTEEQAFLAEYHRRFSATFDSWDLRGVGAAKSDTGRAIGAKLDDMYQPLRIGKSDDPTVFNAGAPLLPEEVLRRTRPLLLIGPGGSGKTTWMRYTFRQFVQRFRGRVLPVFIELRRLARLWQDPKHRGADRSIDAYLFDTVSEEMGTGWSEETFAALLQKGREALRVILFVDGWDELGPLGREVRKKLLGFMESHPNLLVLATSRPYGESKPSYGAGFETRFMQPLCLEREHESAEIERMTTRFFALIHPDEPKLQAERRMDFLAAMIGPAGEDDTSALALARLPLLLTMMLHVSQAGATLPDERDLLYQLCIRNLLQTRPTLKEKEGALALDGHWKPSDSDAALRAVAELAYAMQTGENQTYRQSRQVALAADGLRRLLASNAEATLWTEEQRRCFVNWLAGPAGLLIDRSDDSYTFVHLSFQEYLAAFHLDNTRQTEAERVAFFSEHLDNTEWWETLRLWAALLHRSHPDQHLTPVLEKLEETHYGAMLAGAIMADGWGRLASFATWCDRLMEREPIRFYPAAYEAIKAWQNSRQHSRHTALLDAIRNQSPSANWMQWRWLNEWMTELGAPPAPPPASHSHAFTLAKSLSGPPKTAQAFSVARLLVSVNPVALPIDNPLSLLHVWPSQRTELSGLLQDAAVEDLGWLMWHDQGLNILGYVLDLDYDLARDIANSRARDFARDLTHEYRSSLVRVLARALARPIGRSLALDRDHGIDLARDIFRDFDLVRNIFSYLAFNNYKLDLDNDLDKYLNRDRGSGRDRPRDRYHNSASRASIRVVAAYTNSSSLFPKPYTPLMQAACMHSLHPERGAFPLLEALDQTPETDSGLWHALARHIARMSTEEDRALLTDMAQRPEDYFEEGPLLWSMQHVVRGDIYLSGVTVGNEEGRIVKLDELTDELGWEPLPYLEEMEPELEVDWDA